MYDKSIYNFEINDQFNFNTHFAFLARKLSISKIMSSEESFILLKQIERYVTLSLHRMYVTLYHKDYKTHSTNN